MSNQWNQNPEEKTERIFIFLCSFVCIVSLIFCLINKSFALNQEIKNVSSQISFGPEYMIRKIAQGGIRGLSDEKSKIATNRWNSALSAALTAGRSIPIISNIEAKKTALLIIDMQKAFLDEGAAIEVPEGRLIIDNINVIADKIRKNGGRVIFFRYLVNRNPGLLVNFQAKSYLGSNRESPMKALRPGHPQFEIFPGLNIGKEDIVMDKTRYSAVEGSDIVNILKQNDIENVIITGVTTDVCAGNTAEDLMQRDFNVIMVWDGTAALDRLEHEIFLARIFGLYGDVMPTEEVIKRIL